jgi:hypothetical protein
MGIAFTLIAGTLTILVAATSWVARPLLAETAQQASAPLFPATLEGPVTGQGTVNPQSPSARQLEQLASSLARQQFARGSKVVCGMTVVGADPTIDPRMRITKSDGNFRMPTVPPQVCRGALTPQPTIPPTRK